MSKDLRIKLKLSNNLLKPVGNKRQLKHYKLLPFILVPTLGCFAFYLYTVNGTEGALLVIINSIPIIGIYSDFRDVTNSRKCRKTRTCLKRSRSYKLR